MKPNRILHAVLLCAALCVAAGCSTLFTSVVTVEKVVDSAMKEWAALSASGRTTAAVDDAVIKAHDRYREACGATAAALRKYRDTGDQEAYIRALETARIAADGVIDLIAPLLTKSKAQSLKSKMETAI